MLKRLAELNTMLNMDQGEEPAASNEDAEAMEEPDREEAAGTEKGGNPAQPGEAEADKNPEAVRKEEPWTLEKIKEIKKQRQGGMEAVRHSGKHKEISGTGRT